MIGLEALMVCGAVFGFSTNPANPANPREFVKTGFALCGHPQRVKRVEGLLVE